MFIVIKKNPEFKMRLRQNGFKIKKDNVKASRLMTKNLKLICVHHVNSAPVSLRYSNVCIKYLRVTIQQRFRVMFY